MSVSRFNGKGWVDVTRTIRPGMVHWPGDPDVAVEPVCSLSAGDGCNVSKITMGTHTGTHLDAPRHFLADGAGLDHCPLEYLVGPASVVAIENRVAITLAELVRACPRAEPRVLFQTRSGEANREGFDESYVYLEPDAAEWLRDNGVKLVGIDTMSVDPFNSQEEPSHIHLLGAGIWILENLDLFGIEPGTWDMIALPMKLENADGGPTRVLLRKTG